MTASGAGVAQAQQLVADADLGGRKLGGPVGRLVAAIAIAWSLFQLWYASPLPFALGVFVLNDTQARSIHLAFALFLAFACYPAWRGAPRDRLPALDAALGLIAAYCGAYIVLEYRALAFRPGLPTTLDLIVAVTGMVLLLAAVWRAMGPPLTAVALVFLVYSLVGPWMPEVIAHKGASLVKLMNHQWLTTEGVFGVALGVSTGFVFLFVLFGSLLDKGGAGDYMTRTSFALLGHLRGGPAKVAVVSSALNGVISGSSVSNVVSGGIFTIPMMRRTGLSAVKAGAIETASSVNGQIMPPVMGAAAFLMTEFVGISYAEVIKHAALPAVISYVGLFAIVHIEALKLGNRPLQRAVTRPWRERWLRNGLGISGSALAIVVLSLGVDLARRWLGGASGWALALAAVAVYLGCLWLAARHPEPEPDDPAAPLIAVPELWEVARTGLHFLIPIVILIWCLMVEDLSAGLSAFWATLAMIGILVTQRPIKAWFRGQAPAPEWARGWRDLVEGLELGARNMIGVAAATATAGIVVGTVTLTGMGLMMTEFVEWVSAGNVIVMLLFIALVCLVLGMGVPTTASYIIVATLMAPVVVELGAQAGLVIPLIAVHLFVFYFGIMADITPPVGLASYAAAAISGADPIATGLQGSIYGLRTALLPFLFIFEPRLLLIDVDSVWELVLVCGGASLALILFASITMGHAWARNRWWEALALAVVMFTLVRPGWWLDRVVPAWEERPPGQLVRLIEAAPAGGHVVMAIEGEGLDGETKRKTVSLSLKEPGPVERRLAEQGLRLRDLAGAPQIVEAKLGSPARRAGFETGWRVVAVQERSQRPSDYWLFVPALGLLGLVAWSQRRRQ
ncbi:MAG: TRAP transporter fused permease subunit [Alphaproteobacteria bacterium]|nr:TRAP transporter fused permease subunit [Alphaproteobacteria bacterium]